MASSSVSLEAIERVDGTVRAGVVGGLAGGVGMGVIFHLGANVMPVVGALYGWPTALGGWLAHLLHSLLFGAVFAVVATRPVVREATDTVAGSARVGLVYAGGIGVLMTGLVLPVAMRGSGVRSLPSPLLPVEGAPGTALVVLSVGVAHLVYGVLLGATYGIAREGELSRSERR